MSGREVCISGFSSLTREWANELPESVEVWAMNEAHYYLRRPAARWFQLHPPHWKAAPKGQKAYSCVGYCNTCGWGVSGAPKDEGEKKAVLEHSQYHADRNPEHDIEYGIVRIRKNGYGRPPHHLRWLKNCGIPVYQLKPDPRIPTSVRYPYEEITEKYGYVWANGRKRPYLTSSAAFMAALAIYEHDQGNTIDRLYLAGIELQVGTEYFHQRPCMEHWLGIAVGKGIEVVPSPYGSSLLSGPIYAVEHTEPLFPELMHGTPVGIPQNAPVVAMKEDEDGNPVGF